jgi:hypothetical protein
MKGSIPTAGTIFFSAKGLKEKEEAGCVREREKPLSLSLSRREGRVFFS